MGTNLDRAAEARRKLLAEIEATLRPDGLIQLADGALFADPDLAAARAAHSEGAVDGWRTWRLGDGGLTLAEVTGR